MAREDEDREVVYVERADDSTLKPLLLGMLIGAGLALLFAPQSGEETRRGLRRRMQKLRAMTEEKVDELSDRLGQFRSGKEEEAEPVRSVAVGAGESARPSGGSAREELERRLAEARARRRRPAATAPDDEEPLA